MTAMALVALVAVFAGLDTADTDRYELNDDKVKHFAVSADDQSASVNENSAASTVVLNTVVSGSPTGCAIGNGNTDQDGDGARPFAISSTCVITVNDQGDLDYESYAQSYTLRIHVNDATSADIAFITVTVNDVNDVTPVYQAADADDAITVAENVGTGSIDAGTITDADTGNTFGCTLGGADAADFACTISGSTVNVAFAADPDYENPADADTNNVYVVTVLVDDGTDDDPNGATTLTVTVTDTNDQTPTWQTSTSASVNENVQAVATLSATDTDTADSGGLTYSIVTNDNGLFQIAGGTALQFAAAPDYEDPKCGAGGNSNSCSVTVRATDDAGNSADRTIAVTINDLNLVIQNGQSTTLSESAANGAAVMTVNQIGDSSAVTYWTINGGDTDNIFAINDDGEITVSSNTNLDYDDTTSYTLTIFVSDGALQYDFDTVTIIKKSRRVATASRTIW